MYFMTDGEVMLRIARLLPPAAHLAGLCVVSESVRLLQWCKLNLSRKTLVMTLLSISSPSAGKVGMCACQTGPGGQGEARTDVLHGGQ